MVQFHDFYGPMRPVPHNVYWMLDSGESDYYEKLLERLKSKHYNHDSKNRERIEILYVRCQRGLISYEGFSARELKSFFTQRALPLDLSKKPTVPGLLRLLEKADDDATFDRFLDLPPEIRQQIFILYFDSLDDSGRQSQKGGQPPITLACRQTRQEALPLFYSQCWFPFDSQIQSYCDLGKTQRYKYFADFLGNTSNDNFARIRLLSMRVDAFPSGGPFSIIVTIDLNDNECPLKVSHPYGLPVSSNSRKHVSELLKLETAALVRGIAAREGVLKLQKTDISLLQGSIKGIIQKVLGGPL